MLGRRVFHAHLMVSADAACGLYSFQILFNRQLLFRLPPQSEVLATIEASTNPSAALLQVLALSEAELAVWIPKNHHASERPSAHENADCGPRGLHWRRYA